jgi:hypothetical protein
MQTENKNNRYLSHKIMTLNNLEVWGTYDKGQVYMWSYAPGF